VSHLLPVSVRLRAGRSMQVYMGFLQWFDPSGGAQGNGGTGTASGGV